MYACVYQFYSIAMILCFPLTEFFCSSDLKLPGRKCGWEGFVRKSASSSLARSLAEMFVCCVHVKESQASIEFKSHKETSIREWRGKKRKEVKRSDQKYSSQPRSNAHQEEFTVISLMLPCSLLLPRPPSLLIMSACPGRARRRISSFHLPSDRVESVIRTFVTSICLLRISSSFFVILLPMLAKFTAMPLRLLHRLQFVIWRLSTRCRNPAAAFPTSHFPIRWRQPSKQLRRTGFTAGLASSSSSTAVETMRSCNWNGIALSYSLSAISGLFSCRQLCDFIAFS